MREIGGYFGIEEFHGKEYHSGAIACNCGRSCLALLLQGRNIQRIYLPYYNCDVIRELCVKAGIEICFYHINEDFLPAIQDYRGGSVYIVNYFGLLAECELSRLAAQYQHVIVDNAHNFYAKKVPYADTFNTCRKFFGVPDGGYLYTDAEIVRPQRRAKVLERMNSLVGRLEDGANCHYKEFQKNDDKFSEEGVLGMSLFSQNLMKAVDYESVARRREENYKYIDAEIGKYNLLRKKVLNVPFVYPFLTDDAQRLRSLLIDHKIYIAKYWPSSFFECWNDAEKRYCGNILPLPIDQRYRKEDLSKIIRIIKGRIEK